MKNYTPEQYKQTKFEAFLPMICDFCNNTFNRTKRAMHNADMRYKTPANFHFCSKECSKNYDSKNTYVGPCGTCNKTMTRTFGEAKSSKSGFVFCSQKCAAIYNNGHKSHGNRRSKLEVWLETKLPELFPNLEFKFNSKEEINSELDIYIPSLKLAFELNGIFHFEPIFGQEKLNSIQNNDNRKFAACQEAKISLCLIDTSKQKHFTEKSAQPFLEIIKEHIEKLSPPDCN